MSIQTIYVHPPANIQQQKNCQAKRHTKLYGNLGSGDFSLAIFDC